MLRARCCTANAFLRGRQAIRSATIDPARFLGMDRDIGSIETGKLADLLLLSADPLLNIANTRKIEAVIVKGRFLDRKELDSLLLDAQNAVRNK